MIAMPNTVKILQSNILLLENIKFRKYCKCYSPVDQNSFFKIICISFTIRIDLYFFQDFVCLLCKEIANVQLQIDCSEHKQDEVFTVGENCLQTYLQIIIENIQCDNMNLGTLMLNSFKKEFIDYSQCAGDNSKLECYFIVDVKDIKGHLETDCTIKLIHCQYKVFVCDSLIFKDYEGYNIKKYSKDHIKFAKNKLKNLLIFFLLLNRTIVINIK
ncbi:hypothetical protein RFI_30999 [Reticulomyxa filosa]|uniref:Uncharacterized protein n=1 Tax=Reticulomyxa filosa TaxID=46433 RepID=X6LWW5_RETFI|nr:hypothetical protein RFI_30999 [Reticulomyxa filosa]|eukprot:ETO06398.1 hypothetical protein RFI_30999 [Reticulomyxa filosa]